MSLASPSDLASYMQQDVDTSTATLLLAGATSVCQSYTGQTLTYVQNDTVTLVPYNNEIKLPQRPVIDVTAVEGLASGEWLVVQGVIRPTYLLDGSTNSVWWTGQEITEDPWYSYVAQLPWPTVSVTYSHGFQVIPSDLQLACLMVAGQLMSNPAGVQQEAVGNVMTRYDRAGGAGLTDFVKTILDRYTLTSPGSTLQLLERPMHTNQF
jgi:hypothetical protein